jgi:hypothetical protein
MTQKDLQEDNIYPLDGAPFAPTEPVDQVNDRNAEKAKLMEALPLVQDIIDRFKEKIAFFGSVDSIPEAVKTKPKQFLIVHNANELTRDNLRAEMEWLEGLLEDYTKR